MTPDPTTPLTDVGQVIVGLNVSLPDVRRNAPRAALWIDRAIAALLAAEERFDALTELADGLNDTALAAEARATQAEAEAARLRATVQDYETRIRDADYPEPGEVARLREDAKRLNWLARRLTRGATTLSLGVFPDWFLVGINDCWPPTPFTIEATPEGALRQAIDAALDAAPASEKEEG